MNDVEVNAASGTPVTTIEQHRTGYDVSIQNGQKVVNNTGGQVYVYLSLTPTISWYFISFERSSSPRDGFEEKELVKGAYFTAEHDYICRNNEFHGAPTPDPEPTPCASEPEIVIIDHDTFKSEAPSKTVIASNTLGAKSLFDLKVHAADDRTKANQKFLVQTLLIDPNAKILITENIYPRRDLSTTENGSLQTLTWNNLPKNQAGPVYAVAYNQIDGAYVINGLLDANGTATFIGFKLRPASTITICK